MTRKIIVFLIPLILSYIFWCILVAEVSSVWFWFTGFKLLDVLTFIVGAVLQGGHNNSTCPPRAYSSYVNRPMNGCYSP